MIGRLHFDVRDIPSSARYGLSARKMWIYWKAQILAWLIWTVSVYLGYIAAGVDLSSRWQTSRLLPLPGGIFWESWPSLVLLSAGILLILYVLLAASLKVARITFEQIRGDDFYSGRDAAGFCRKHHKPLITVPVTLLVGLLIALSAVLVFGLIGRIPLIGPVLIGLFAVPAWAFALLAVLTAVGLLLSFLLVPSIIASTHGDTFESLFELFSSLTSQPWRMFLYWITGVVCRFIGMVILLLFTFLAIAFLSWGVSTGTGVPGFGESLSSGLQMVAPEAVPYFANIFNPLAQAVPGEGWTGIAGLLVGLSGVAIILIIKAYWLSSGTSAWTLIYLSIRHRKDGENLLKRSDDEEYREFEKLYGADPAVSSHEKPAKSDEQG